MNFKKLPLKKGLAIDWETSGSTFGATVNELTQTFQGISFGAVVFDFETFTPIETMYRELHFDDKYTWSMEAEGIHGLSREHLAKHGVSREDGVVDLLNMIMPHFGNSPIVFLGHRVGFDIAFTKQLVNDFDMDIKAYHLELETSSAAFIFTGLHRSDDVFSMLTTLEKREKHNALDDALAALEVARTLRAVGTEIFG